MFNSDIDILNPPSPNITATCLFGAANLAPIAPAKEQPIGAKFVKFIFVFSSKNEKYFPTKNISSLTIIAFLGNFCLNCLINRYFIRIYLLRLHSLLIANFIVNMSFALLLISE